MNVLIVYKLLVCSILTFQQLATQISVELLFVSRIHFYKATGNIFSCIPCESRNQKLVTALENLKMTVWLTIFVKKRKLTKIIITRFIDSKR